MNNRYLASPRLGMVNLSTVEGRSNLTKAAIGVALGGGALYSVAQLKNAKGMNQLAWGGLSVGLAIGSLLSVYDGLSA